MGLPCCKGAKHWEKRWDRDSTAKSALNERVEGVYQMPKKGGWIRPGQRAARRDAEH